MRKINDIIQKIMHSKYIGYIIIFVLSCIIIAPIFSMDLTQNNEAKIHMARILSIDSVIKDGIFPPIIDYSYMNGFGYALNLFYGPLTTYIPIILLNILGTSALALKVFTFFTVFISGITMYNFIYTVTKRKAIATIGAIIYISTPYKLSNIYSRNAVGEYTAFIFIPVVFEGLYNIINNKKKNYLLCIGIIGLILSHTISTVYTAVFAVIYLLLNIEKLKKLRIWKSFIINAVVALVVCMFYIIPLAEYKLIGNYSIYDTSVMHTGTDEVFTTGLGFSDLFASEFGDQEIRFSLGIMTCILTLLGAFCYKKIKKEYKGIYLSFLLLSIIALIMSTKLFPWFILPDFFGVIQFAWRNLGFLAFFISLVCGINAVTFAENFKKEWVKDTILFAIIVSTCVFSALGTIKYANKGDLKNEKAFDEYTSQNERIYPYSINREYLSINALNNLDYMIERKDCSYVISGQAEIVNEDKNKLQDKIELKNVSDGTVIELPYVYYLGYKISVTYDSQNSQNIVEDSSEEQKNDAGHNLDDTSITKKIDTFETENGFLAIELDECSSATITVEYKGTLAEKIGYIISLAGIVILIIMIYKERRNSLLYENEQIHKQ